MLRWQIAVLVAIAIAISYLDRQALPVAIQAIARDIPVTNEQFSQLQSAFLIAYAFMYVGGGKLMDVLGTRRGFTVIMAFWSLACASHGLAVSVGTLAAQPVPPRHRRRGRISRRDAGGRGMVPRPGALHGHGHHQRRHRRRHGRCAADDRPGAERRRLALRLLPDGGPRPGLDPLVAPRLLPARPAPEARRRRAPGDTVGPRCGHRRPGGPALAAAAAFPPDLGRRDRQVPERRGVVLLPVLAAEVPL